MAQITDLPEELIVMIVRRLDFRSLCSMYNSCKFFRNLLSLRGVVLECNMSLSTVATVNTVTLNFFKVVSNHLLALNMCGVPDLTKTKVLPAFRKLKHLKVLDISYTNLNISDLKAIHSACPTLKDIAIDFKFGPTPHLNNILQESQSLFEHFENVHFVGSIHNLFESMLVLHVLKKSKLDTLKFSAVEVDNVQTTVITNRLQTESQLPHFSHFAAYLLSFWGSKRTYENVFSFPIISMIELKNYEFCVIYTTSHTHDTSVYATPLFNNFFSENFNVITRCVTDYKTDPKSGVALMVWNKETTQFDDKFFQKLYSRVKPYFPFFFEALSDVSCPQNCNWIYSYPRPNMTINIDSNNDRCNFGFKRRKTLMSNIILNYDNLLKDKVKVQLSLIFMPEQLVSATLPSDGNYFSKITFLSLSGAVRYNTDFFNNLFQWCHNLNTLSVEIAGFKTFKYSYDIVQAIHVSQTMKNLRLVDKGMDFEEIFNSLSKCKTLENINLVDLRQWDHCGIADPTLLIESCSNLYSVFIEAPFSETAQIKQLKWFNKVKISCKRPHLKVVINRASHNTCRVYGYDPFVDVFKLSPIKPF